MVSLLRVGEAIPSRCDIIVLLLSEQLECSRTRVDKQTDREELGIFFRPSYVQAIDAERGGGIMIKGREDRTKPITLRPDSLSDRFITPQDTCAGLGYTRR